MRSSIARRTLLPRRVVPVLALVLCLAAPAVFAADAGSSPGPSLADGQRVEVREGDTWSAATVVKREGRKYLIHYEGGDAGSDEWVTTDRIRQPGSASGSAAPRPTSAPAPARPAAAPKKFFPIGQQVEVKSGPWWKKAVVVNHRGDWVLVDIDGKPFWRQWVEPWRMRTVGSADDISGWAKDNPWVHHGEGPPRDQPGPAPDDSRPDKGQADTGEPASDVALTPAVRVDVKAVSLDGLEPLARLAPDPAPAVKTVAAPVRLAGSTGGFFDTPQAIVVSPATAIAAVLYHDGDPGKQDHTSRIERVDLTTGRSLNVVGFSYELQPLDLSPDGKLLACRPTASGPAMDARLDVWQIDGDKPTHVVSFMPFPKGGGENVVWARFAGAEHVIVGSFGGDLGCYAFRTAQQVWLAKAGPGGTGTLSSGGKYLAVATNKQIAILEPLTGKPLGQIDLIDRPVRSIAFKPDGGQLAAAGEDSLRIWDLASGAVTADVSAVGARGADVDWGQEGYLLLDDSLLVSLQKQVVAWSYRGGGGRGIRGRTGAVLNGRLYYTAEASANNGRRRPAIASVAIPDDNVKGTLAAIGEPKMIVKPGISVSLDVNVDGSIRQQVVDALTAKLKDNGITVGANQPIKLVARDEPGQNREISYRRIGFGAFGQVDKLSVQELKRSLEIQGSDGKPLWRRAGVMMPPFFISLKQGESIQQAVDEQMKPKASYYQGLRLPKFIPKVTTGFGTSNLTGAGAEPPKPNRGKEQGA